MRTAREVIAEAIFADDMGCPGDSVDFSKESERCRENYGRNADAAIAALRAEGLVIVAAADVAYALDWARLKHGQIVVMEHETRPADAVVVMPEIAATLQEAAHNAAIDADEQAERVLMECMSPLEADEWNKAAETYRAAAAALRGEG